MCLYTYIYIYCIVYKLLRILLLNTAVVKKKKMKIWKRISILREFQISYTFQISSVIRTGLLVVLLCIVKITIEEPLDGQLPRQTTCPSQCVCTPTEMLCSGANLTEVLLHEIDYPVRFIIK